MAKEKCRLYKYGQYLLPRKIEKRKTLGICIWYKENKFCRIFVAKGNGIETFVTLVHEYLHYLNFIWFKNNKKINKIIEVI